MVDGIDNPQLAFLGSIIMGQPGISSTKTQSAHSLHYLHHLPSHSLCEGIAP